MTAIELAREWQAKQAELGNLIRCPKNALISEEACRVHAAVSKFTARGTRGGHHKTGRDHRWRCKDFCPRFETIKDSLPKMSPRFNAFRWGKAQEEIQPNGKRIKSYIMKVLNNEVIPRTSGNPRSIEDNEKNTGDEL